MTSLRVWPVAVAHQSSRIWATMACTREFSQGTYLLGEYSWSILPAMSVPLTLLGLLERGPSHGYDLKRDYDAYFGRGRPLRYSQVYATLSRPKYAS